jgi:acyl-CoA dehydrogenase
MQRDLFEAEHEQFRQTVRRFIEREVSHHDRCEKEGIVDRAV